MILLEIGNVGMELFPDALTTKSALCQTMDQCIAIELREASYR